MNLHPWREGQPAQATLLLFRKKQLCTTKLSGKYGWLSRVRFWSTPYLLWQIATLRQEYLSPHHLYNSEETCKSYRWKHFFAPVSISVLRRCLIMLLEHVHPSLLILLPLHCLPPFLINFSWKFDDYRLGRKLVNQLIWKCSPIENLLKTNYSVVYNMSDKARLL